MDRLLNFFSPDNYNLELTIDRQKETIDGKVIITGVPTNDAVKFHAVDMDIDSVVVAGEESNFNYQDGVLEIPVDNDLAGQAVNFEIVFHTKLNKNMQACYLSTYQHKGKTERIATTQFESHYARECFPCIDEPAAKATFDLTLIVPDLEDGDVVLANTPLAKNSEGKTFVFETTPRMSTYLLAWVIGKFHAVETTNKNGVKVATYGALNQPKSSLEFANDTAARALEYYDSKFDHPYPLPKLDQVALPDFEAGAMENWGLVTYRESMMLADKNATLDTKQSVALTVTHELSHQWFGDLVTMNWWDDLWLNESFASIMEYYCTDALYPEFDIWQGFYTGDCVAALRRDALQGVQAVQQEVKSPAEIATLFDGAIVYAKGARLVLMLIHLLGEDKFDQGIRDYFEKFQYNNTVGDDLWQALQKYADFDVKEFMHAWISQPGYPEIRNGEQKRFLLNGETDNTKWPLPEIFDDMSGHYLLNLSDAEFAGKLEGFSNLSTEQRLRLLIDRMLLAKVPEIETASLLDLLPKFAQEKSAPVWDVLQNLIADIKLFCPPETEVCKNYKNYLSKVFRERFKEIDYGVITDTNEVKLRDAILSLALYCEDQKVQQKLVEMYNDDLAGINSELRAGVLISVLKNDEQKYFTEFLQKYQSENDPEIKADLLYVLASYTREAGNLDRLVGLLEQPEIVRPQDHLYLFIYLMRNHFTREKVLDWMLENWAYIEKLTGEKSVEDYPRYAAAIIRTEDEAKRFYNFFDPKKEIPVLKRTIEIAHVEIDARLKLIEHDTPAVVEKLTELVKQG